MKTLRLHRILIAFTVVLGLVALARIADPGDPKLTPELAVFTIGKHRFPRDITGGPPPPGTYWEVYSVPMSYPEVVEAMKRMPGWRATEGADPMAVVKASFFSTEAGRVRQVEVRPGYLVRGEDLISSDSRRALDLARLGDNSVVTIAVREDGFLKRAMTAFISRLRGTPPVPVAVPRNIVFLRDEKYAVPPTPAKRVP